MFQLVDYVSRLAQLYSSASLKFKLLQLIANCMLMVTSVFVFILSATDLDVNETNCYAVDSTNHAVFNHDNDNNRH